jgi:hypothetical protein
MAKFSEAQKWVAHRLSNGWELCRVVDYCYVKKHPFEYRVHLATFRAMFDNGLIELSHVQEPARRVFRLTPLGRTLGTKE